MLTNQFFTSADHYHKRKKPHVCSPKKQASVALPEKLLLQQHADQLCLPVLYDQCSPKITFFSSHIDIVEILLI